MPNVKLKAGSNNERVNVVVSKKKIGSNNVEYAKVTVTDRKSGKVISKKRVVLLAG